MGLKNKEKFETNKREVAEAIVALKNSEEQLGSVLNRAVEAIGALVSILAVIDPEMIPDMAKQLKDQTPAFTKVHQSIADRNKEDVEKILKGLEISDD